MKTKNRLFARLMPAYWETRKRGNPISTLVFVKKNKKKKLCKKNKKPYGFLNMLNGIHPIEHIFNFPILLFTPYKPLSRREVRKVLFILSVHVVKGFARSVQDRCGTNMTDPLFSRAAMSLATEYEAQSEGEKEDDESDSEYTEPKSETRSSLHFLTKTNE
jgi:hypothetical protein